MNKIKAAVIGSTGYAGEELTRILACHKNVEIKFLTSKTYLNQKYGEIYQNFNNILDINCVEDDFYKILNEADVIFLALPHGIASKIVSISNKAKIIDLGADFRLKEKEVYEKWYKTKHFSPELLNTAVYGLSEIYREKIKNAKLAANPGCYATCSILSLYPLLKFIENSIIIDAKSGVTGAGRGINLGVHYCETNENIKAYKIGCHRHIPEIEQELFYAAGRKLRVQFTPHLIPMNRGILTTSYAKLKAGISFEEVKKAYTLQFGNEKFIRILKSGIYPETKWVKGSNFLDIGLFYDERTENVIVQGAIDNLIKGAAGQAVQNMNIMFGLNEDTGLSAPGIFPV